MLFLWLQRMLKIYTKTGDKGETSLLDGKRVSKNDLRVEVLGEVDELNSAIGVAIAQVSSGEEELTKIQRDLFKIGVLLGKREKGEGGRGKGESLEVGIKEFEKMIDKLAKKLPEIKNFILPGGGKFGAALHLARAICRRVERRIVTLSEKEKVDPEILIYFNRLSDLLFIMARFVNFQEKKKEIIFSG